MLRNDGAKASTPAQTSSQLEPTMLALDRVRLFPSERHVLEQFEYDGRVIRSVAEPIDAWLCDEAYLLAQGFTREEIAAQPMTSEEIAALLDTPTETARVAPCAPVAEEE